MNSAPAFWIIALVLVALTVAALVWPLLRPRDATRAVADDDASADVYRDQKRQLEADVAAGAITLDERNAGLDEIAARLGDELQPVAAGPAASRRTSTFAAIALAAILPVTALVLYAALGRPDVMRTAAANAAAPRSEADIVAMVDKLAARMKEQPEDATGWKLLGRAYAAMGRYDASVGAFRQAAARSPDVDASLLADWADALAMKNQSLTGEPADLVMRALAREPTHAKALSLAAAAALERRDFDGAIAQWRTLAAQFPPESPEARDIAAMIADADVVRRRPVPSESAAVAAATGPGTSPPPPAVAATRSDAEASAITGRVTLDAALRSRVSPSDTLFIYARPASGPRMPLAIIRTTAADLPRDFTLDDSKSMLPEARLSRATNVVVEARVSKRGGATPSSGDLRGASPPLKPGARDVPIVIDDVVP